MDFNDILKILPFILFLLCIAFLPMQFSHFWEHHLNKTIISLLFALPVFFYYIIKSPQELSHSLIDYFSFITLLASLFIISGGILLSGDIKATPITNLLFLFFGTVLANFIGTTGASMLLIRPLLSTNSQRKHTTHIFIFFIFLVSNIGGSLTALGDPPLFLGYLKGVPFLWTLKLFPEWIFTAALVLFIFYLMENYYYQKEGEYDLKLDAEKISPLKVAGVYNFFLLAVIILVIFFQTLTPFREILMLVCAFISYRFTDNKIHQENKFDFDPILEVAIIFLAIFITMIPALSILHNNAASFGITKPYQFFWASGILSSFLDNAPTYLTFMSLAQGVTENLHISTNIIAGVSEPLLKAISCGAVFMGANSYIGNGPNFMVKAIAEQNGIKMPSFFGYIRYSLAILVPIFLLVTWRFFR